MTPKKPPRLKVFFDANVLFAAVWNPDGIAGHTLRHPKLVHAHVSELALDEARRNLTAKKPEALPRLAELLTRMTVVPTAATGPDVPLPEKDQRIFWSALAHAADYLITGDKDFSPLVDSPMAQGIKVLSPRQFYEEIAQLGRLKGKGAPP